MPSETLRRLNELRENLDKKSRKVPDYHISSNKDYHITKKVTTDDIKSKQRKKKDTTPKNIVTEKIRNQIKQLFNYGFDVRGKTKISVSADLNQKYERFKFKDEFQVASVLTEYSKGADVIVFIVDVDNDSIIWNNYGSKEIRLYRQ